ncbi:hypothetical protein [Rhodococcus sp. 2G]|uniref:hypothetical protein n=1 Tax=Rhodococcus TaxID=1827 RepID=UPI0012EB9BDD|nr:hypothetical protein [Rhodococcus sp. 2G]
MEQEELTVTQQMPDPNKEWPKLNGDQVYTACRLRLEPDSRDIWDTEVEAPDPDGPEWGA